MCPGKGVLCGAGTRWCKKVLSNGSGEVLEGMVETEWFDIFNVKCNSFQVIELCNKLEFTTDALDDFVDISSVLISEFCSPMRHDTGEDKVSDLKGASDLCLFKIFLPINSMVICANKVAYNVNHMVIVASGRGGTDNVTVGEMRRVPKCHFVCGSFDGLWSIRSIDVVSALHRIGDELCKIYNISLRLMQ